MSRKVIIEKVHQPAADGIMPVLMRFQNGQLNSNANAQFFRTCNKKTKELGAAVIVGDDVYHGAINAETQNELVDTYMAVHNKITNKVQLVPVQTALLKHVLLDDLSERKQEVITADVANIKRLREYGGRKAASRLLANTEKTKISIDLLKEDMAKTVEAAANATAQADQDEANLNLNTPMEEIRPPFNADAQDLQDIYEIHDLIPEALLKRLDAECKAVFATPTKNLPIASDYLKSCVQTLQTEPQSHSTFLHVKIILYLDCLHTVIKSRVRNMRTQELSKITEKVENDVRMRFADPKSNDMKRTNYTAEKALCYYIVLVLFIQKKFQMDANLLMEDLSITRDKLRKYAQIVNAVIKPNNILTLSLPSKMPKLAPGNRFRKRKHNN